MHFFKVRRNVTFEWAKFNWSDQAAGEGVELYITSHYSLIETYEYGELRRCCAIASLSRLGIKFCLKNCRWIPALPWRRKRCNFPERSYHEHRQELQGSSKTLVGEARYRPKNQTQRFKLYKAGPSGSLSMRSGVVHTRVANNANPARDVVNPGMLLQTKWVPQQENLLQYTKSNQMSSNDLELLEVTTLSSYDAQPYSSLCISRKVPFALQKKVQVKLVGMKSMGVISKVSDPTIWCIGIVVIRKKSGTVRICIDFQPLNEIVLHVVHPISEDEAPDELSGAIVFRKLDANSEFWQIPLSP